MNRYYLYTWPESQAFVGNGNAVLVIPPKGKETELDSAYMVPDPDGDYAYIDIPDSQMYEGQEGVLGAYDLNGLFVPVILSRLKTGSIHDTTELFLVHPVTAS